MKPTEPRRWFQLSLTATAVFAIWLATRAPLARAGEVDDVLGGSVISKIFGLGSSEVKRASDPAATHEFKKAVKIRSTDGANGVQTFCIDGKGRIVALVAPPRRYDGSAKGITSEVHLLSSEGEPLTHWTVDFHGHSINVGPDGSVYVAGDGTIARFSPEGKTLKTLELPHIAELLKNKESIRKRAEEESRQQRQSSEQIRVHFKQRIKDLEAKPADKLSKVEARNLEQYRRSLKMFEADNEETNIDAVVKAITGRLRIINSVAVSEKDIFIVCGESTGYGYSLWRMDHEFQNATQIMKGLSGCCGQMDVQVQGADVLVAENCQHAFARYDRNGKKLGQWGQVSRSGDVKCFGGCCNPMNVRCGPNGDVLTAESEGFVKRFNSKGEFVALVGKRPLSGGCKNVAVAASADGKFVYFCDQPGSQIIILAEKAKTVAEAKAPNN